MGVRGAIRTAINGVLTTAGGTALWGQRVHYGQATLLETLPYVVFQHISGGDLNLAPSRIVDEFYQVVCYAANAQDARSGGEYIETALREATLSVSGFGFMACTQNDFISKVDTIEGVQYWSEGGEYRIRVNS